MKYTMGNNIGLNFIYGITSVDEMLKQIELLLNKQEQSTYLSINNIRICFDKIKYTKHDYDIKFYEIYFLKNDDEVAYIEVYDTYKITCHLFNNSLYEIDIEEVNAKNQ